MTELESLNMVKKLPSVMVLVFEERLGCSVWQDYEHHGTRSLRRLIRKLSFEVKSGRFVGYRLFRKELEIIGVCPNAESQFLERAEAASA